MNKWSRIKNLPSRGAGKNGKRITACSEHIEFSRYAATEGMVLLKNDGILPLEKGSKIAIFGKAQIDYIKGGGGSGDVYCRYTRNIYDGMKIKEEEGKIKIIHEISDFYVDYINENPRLKPELLVDEAILTPYMVKKAREEADIAIITICRYSGEGYDRVDEDFYLSDREKKMVEAVCAEFQKVVVVLNVGGVVDTEWFCNNDKIGASLMAWNGGMEGGLAIADILVGDVNPSGKLTDTFARSFSDYPSSENFNESDMYVKYYEDIYVGYRYFETIPGAKDKVNYPFGFGLSYTDFEISNITGKENDGMITITADVKNTGIVSGKEVVQVYCEKPQGKLGKPARELCAFKKTKLLAPCETQTVTMSFAVNSLASFDDLGKCSKSSYILEGGEYIFHVGNSVRNTKIADYKYVVEEEYKVTEQLEAHIVPERLEKRMLADGSFEELPMPMPRTPRYFNEERIPAPEPKLREKIITLDKVVKGKATLDEFLDQLSLVELVKLLGGKPDRGVAVTGGMGGEVTDSTGVDKFGIPCAMTTDGPAGVRCKKDGEYLHTTAFPCATLLACTWDPDILYKKGETGAIEVKENNMAIWLTPGMNIHRNPLCGRNFEYFSEDPLITGVMASAEVRGIQSQNISACPKHFACNNKEQNRCFANAVVSERALREIYLKGFEICVKTAEPWVIMSSYNLINGFRTAENEELLEDILRGEWGYKGLVTTDWGTYSNQRCEIMSGNDVKMWTGDNPIWVAFAEFNIYPHARQSAKRLLELMFKFD